jgi:hypothetical protein
MAMMMSAHGLLFLFSIQLMWLDASATRGNLSIGIRPLLFLKTFLCVCFVVGGGGGDGVGSPLGGFL